MRYHWDVESYENFFCAGFINDSNVLEMHYLVNSKEDEALVLEACKDSGYTFRAEDLRKSAKRLVEHFKRQIPTQGTDTLLGQFLGIKDEEVKPKEHEYIAFNSLSYDIQMLDFLLKSVIGNRVQTTTEALRAYSDTLINNTGRRVSTRDYEQFGNQIDAVFLNEKMIDNGRPTIGLKTMVGMKGGSIIESESNTSGFSKNIYKDTLYNINDISELKDVVFPDTMEQTLTVRKGLLERYPSLAENGVTPNSSSAKFVEFIVSPDKPIEDTPVVSYLYPAKHTAEKLGVEQKDMLEDTKDWYMREVYAKVAQHNPKAAKRHLAKFLSIYEFYASFRGKNFNESTRHLMRYGIPAEPKSARRERMLTYGTFIPLIDKYGNDSYTYENFSFGGIHGAEIFRNQLDNDRKRIKELRDKYKYISKIPAEEKVPQALMNLIKAQSRTPFGDYPQYLTHEIPYFFDNTEECDEIVDPEDFTPFMVQYKTDKKTGNRTGGEKLIERYKYTSAGYSVHQDFAGYYPMLLINMGAFYDGNGRDTYEEVYNLRIAIKSKLKTLKFGSREWIETNIIQEGYKLVLNSASGALDAGFDTNLRGNNKAMAMRILGQLFTFRIAARLAIEGATVPSSNTDGIYVFNIDEDLNKQLVDAELEALYVKIDPEPLYLVSKDTNNRMEMEDGEVKSAKGGSLTAWQGPTITQRLTHPALSDNVLTRYLQNENILDKPVDKELIAKALMEAREEFDHRTMVLMASWIMRSTSGSILLASDGNVYTGTIRGWLTKTGVKLEKYTTKSSQHSKTFDAYASQLFGDTKIGDPNVISELTDKGLIDKYFERAVTVDQYRSLPRNQSFYAVSKQKVANLSPTSLVYINNQSILKMSEKEIEEIYNQLDWDEYVTMFASQAKVWHNVLMPS